MSIAPDDYAAPRRADRPGGRAIAGAGDLTPLDRAESLALLASVRVSRVAFVSGNPDILPVNHVVIDGDVAFRTGAGSKLGAAAAGSEVAVEADRFDDAAESGWSVVVHGPARIVTDEAEIERLLALDFEPWALPDTRSFWIRVEGREVTGRRLGAG